MALPQQQQQPPDEATIRTRLLQSFGVQPCQEWLQACLSHLRNNGTNQNKMVDGVLHQLIHTDLRDVVRNMASSSPNPINAAIGAGGAFHTAASALSGSDTSTAAQQLQQAIQQSLQSPYKHTLPNNFVLMCQLEEVCDASLPAEKRIEVAVSAPSGQSSSSSQRCLKLCLTDGYQYHNNNNNNNKPYFVGFEMQAPIPNLAADAPAGCKILLKGPVVVRHGQLLLTPANGIVLGGHVHALEQQQRQALQKAKQAAGVGVDPTIRALIGVDNEINDMENEDQDEAHEASGDVLPRQPRNPVVTQTTPSVTAAAAAAMPSTRRGSQHPATAATLATETPRSAWAPSQQQQQQQPQQNSNLQPQQHHHHQQQQPLQQQPIQPTIQSQPQRTPPPTNRTSPYVNPYATGSSHSSASTAATTTTTSNPYVQSRTTNTVASVNPYRNSNATAASIESRSTTVNSTIPTSSNTSTISSNTIPRTVVPNPNEPNPTTTSKSSSTTAPQRTNIQNMTFPNLCTLLTNLVQNREMYQSYSQISFRVTLTKALVGSVNFNVVKNKHHRKKDPTSQKYEYYIALLFAGINDHDQRLCCRIHTSLLDPHFEVSAADLRSISRTDRERSHHITNAGGDRVKQHYFGPCTWTASLYLPVEEVFGNDNKTPAERLTDLNHPIVMLQDPEPYNT
jgi:RecQ mediated genome instability protein